MFAETSKNYILNVCTGKFSEEFLRIFWIYVFENRLRCKNALYRRIFNVAKKTYFCSIIEKNQMLADFYISRLTNDM